MVKKIAPFLLQLLLQPFAFGILLATVLGFFGSWHWRIDLLSHFRLQYLFAALGISLVLLLMRSRLAVWLSITALLINSYVILPFYLQPPENKPTTQRTPSLFVFNVLTENKHFDDILNYINQRQPDVIALTEIDLAWVVRLKPLEATYPYRRLAPRGGHAGVGIYSRVPFTGEATLLVPRGFWSVVGQLQLDGKTINLIATHPVAPTNARSVELRDTQIQALADLAQHSPHPMLMLGDFNATPWSAAFQPFYDRTRLRNSTLGFGLQPTWNAFNTIVRIPIDHVWLSPELSVIEHYVGPALGSDHFPVEVMVALH